MRSYKLLSAERCAEIAATIRAEDWAKGYSVRELGSVKKVTELRHQSEAARPLLEEIGQAILDSAIPQREFIEGVFDPRFQRYEVGDEYKIHSDAAYMSKTRTDLAMTLFLNDDYEGGVLHIDGLLPNDKPLPVRAEPGYAVVYACGRPHWVTPVTSGERLVAITWLQSKIPEEHDRELLTRLHRVIDDIERPGTSDGNGGLRHMTPQERFANLGSVHQSMVKRFST